MASVVASVEVLGPNLSRLHVQWGSDAAGDASIRFDGEDAPLLSGIIDRIVTRPALTAPTDNYDMTLEDIHGYDVLEGTGANRDTATVETAWPRDSDSRQISTLGPLWLRIANAGASKHGELYLYLRAN